MQVRVQSPTLLLPPHLLTSLLHLLLLFFFLFGISREPTRCSPNHHRVPPTGFTTYYHLAPLVPLQLLYCHYLLIILSAPLLSPLSPASSTRHLPFSSLSSRSYIEATSDTPIDRYGSTYSTGFLPPAAANSFDRFTEEFEALASLGWRWRR